MIKGETKLMVLAVVLMMIVYHVDVVNSQMWVCQSGFTNCNNGYCCAAATPICGGVGKCCPSAYPTYYNDKCYNLSAKSTDAKSEVVAVAAVRHST
ncbi:unnamed protein product [Adineta steineri]|uniref:Uncharacterized protein n=1 Tax=Adineta steineri TaxID=433720 RepID=A0A819PCG3_9BILA|nr:unnamed protein product [Adineta steineri]